MKMLRSRSVSETTKLAVKSLSLDVFKGKLGKHLSGDEPWLRGQAHALPAEAPGWIHSLATPANGCQVVGDA